MKFHEYLECFEMFYEKQNAQFLKSEVMRQMKTPLNNFSAEFPFQTKFGGG